MTTHRSPFRPLVAAASLMAAFALAVTAVPAPTRADGPGTVVAQYYAWYDTDSFTPDLVADAPVAPYNSDDGGTIGRHVSEAAAAGIDALALSWLGPQDGRTDGNLQKLLAAGAGAGVQATVTVETDKPTFGNAENIVAGVRYLRDRYTNAGNWLRYNGRPVVMFWRPDALPTDGGSLVDAWRAVRDAADPNGELAWVMEGLSWDLLSVFDGQFGYSLAWSPNPANTTASWASRVRAKGKLFIATVMPGYDDTRVRPAPEGFSRDRGDGAFLGSTWQAAIRTGAEWVNVTSFNEWIEGSQIEPSTSYGDLYVRLNREWSDRFKGR